MKSHERLKALNVINHNTYCRQFFQGGKILREALTQKLLGVVIFSYKTCSEHKPLICHPLLAFFPSAISLLVCAAIFQDRHTFVKATSFHHRQTLLN